MLLSHQELNQPWERVVTSAISSVHAICTRTVAVTRRITLIYTPEATAKLNYHEPITPTAI